MMLIQLPSQRPFTTWTIVYQAYMVSQMALIIEVIVQLSTNMPHMQIFPSSHNTEQQHNLHKIVY